LPHSAPAYEATVNISAISAARMAVTPKLLFQHFSRPSAWLTTMFSAKLAAELGLPAFVTMPNIRRLINELNGSAE
tara:strand:+ start:80 stop:307 length:228 start_codon:yes stop_codon:yes gene_type:complete